MQYIVEKEGQFDFFNDYLKIINPSLKYDDIFKNNTDGILNGNLFEFKINITDLNKVLFQAIKYLSAMRIKGEPIPFNILLVSLNEQKIYVYHSAEYLSFIEQVYVGSASKNNTGFMGSKPICELHYKDNQNDEAKLIDLLRENKFTKIHIDENCIVGWAEKYYSENPSARKSDFIGETTGKVKIIGEIRDPNKFKNYIHPYAGKDNIKFQYLMDKLNDTLQKKNLGAFYTPELYVNKSIELVRKAIERVPKENDYIILDRCAGTGNLEKGLSDEELSHCIVSTVEYYEYKVLLEVLGSRVRYIIPPTEKDDTFNMGLVRGADALSKEYIDNPVIKQYIDNEKCTIILFENPPYSETTSAEHQRHGASKNSSAMWKTGYVVENMKDVIRNSDIEKSASNDMGNAFIWSGFKYYLRQPTDSYIVFSPVKYWKAQHLIKKQFLMGYAFNRKYFHTNIEACIMCALWANIDDTKTNELTLTGYDIVDGKLEKCLEKLPVKYIEKTFSRVYYDKRTFIDTKDGIACALNGLEFTENSRIRIQKNYNDNIIGYMVANGVNFDNPDINTTFLRAGQYNGNGFFVRRDNYLEKLPMFAAGRYITYNRKWTERARIMKSADGAGKFINDVKTGKLDGFLHKCLLFTCFEMQNHIRTFKGSDGRFYRNELCLDVTSGKTIASNELKDMAYNEDEIKLISLWNHIIQNAKCTRNYDLHLTYGIYQIYAELNTKHKDELTGKMVPDYPELNGNLVSMKKTLADYYNKEIVPILFEYEFLK